MDRSSAFSTISGTGWPSFCSTMAVRRRDLAASMTLSGGKMASWRASGGVVVLSLSVLAVVAVDLLVRAIHAPSHGKASLPCNQEGHCRFCTCLGQFPDGDEFEFVLVLHV